MMDLTELPRLADSVSFLYIDHAIIEQDSFSVTAYQKDGKVPIPIASTTCLMLGPGTRITHAAIRTIADSGCLIIWCGESGGKFYASGTGETRSAANLLRQAKYCMDDELHMLVVRRMYALRFPELSTDGLDLQQIRGFEGMRVRKAYEFYSKLTGVKWKKRDYKTSDWDEADPINRALSEANALLYGICHAAIVTLGYSPGLGFVHTGKQRSFVYDIADLYKTETTIPAAFEAVKGGEDISRAVRAEFRQRLAATKIMARIPKDLDKLFDSTEETNNNMQQIGDLWTENGAVPGGRNFMGEQ